MTFRVPANWTSTGSVPDFIDSGIVVNYLSIQKRAHHDPNHLNGGHPMRPLFLLLLIMFVFPSQNPSSSQEESSLKVLGSKWYKTRQAVENVDTTSVAPVRGVIQANKNFERNVRINAPVGARDP